MPVAAIYDVHGNLPALEAVLAEVEASGAGIVICAGDAVAGPFPREVVARLRDLGDRIRFVRGNADRNVVDAASGHDADAQARWCGAQLASDDLDFLARLPLTESVAVDQLGTVLFCHATPRSDEEIVTRITPESRMADALAEVEADLVVCGHVHVRYDRAVAGKRVVNPGSVGLPYEAEPGAYWALLGPGVSLRRAEYDVGAAMDAILATGFPAAEEMFVETLLTPPPPDEVTEHFERIARERR